MRYIAKGNEPHSLVEHRLKEHADFENLADKKKEIKEALLKEQGHICCYCLKRIYFDDMKVEHWKCQDKYPELQLKYNNMFGACNGNEGQKRYLQTCDTLKGNEDITVNPLNRHQIESIKYAGNGLILCDAMIERDLNEILNLNNQSMVNNRKSVIDGVFEYLRHEYPDRLWTKALIQRELDKWDRVDAEGKLKEYCEAAIYFLRKRYIKARA